MFNALQFLSSEKGDSLALALPFGLVDMCRDWEDLRMKMIRDRPEDFSREEWAFLIHYVASCELMKAFLRWGNLVEEVKGPVTGLLRPAGKIAIWLPNNVTLLGPLLLASISLTGNQVFAKAGTRSVNLTESFRQFCLDNLSDGPLRFFWQEQVTVEQFDYNDERNSRWTEQADVRIVFGTEDAARSIHELPHPIHSSSVSFTERQSQAWFSPDVIGSDAIDTLIKVFAIYGQAGCTSPRKVWLIDGNEEDARGLQKLIAQRWLNIIKARPDRHLASACVLDGQLGRAYDWNVRITENNAAVILAGSAQLKEPSGLSQALLIVWGSANEALRQLPRNIQTIGYEVGDNVPDDWISLVSRTRVLRFVPLRRMHHFHHQWDGIDYWSLLFEHMEL